jgi:hypothetical protein
MLAAACTPMNCTHVANWLESAMGGSAASQPAGVRLLLFQEGRTDVLPEQPEQPQPMPTTDCFITSRTECGAGQGGQRSQLRRNGGSPHKPPILPVLRAWRRRAVHLWYGCTLVRVCLPQMRVWLQGVSQQATRTCLRHLLCMAESFRCQTARARCACLSPPPFLFRPAAAKLRSLERCSAALLMGCSSGRLRAQAHYEPVGAVLAYLLAGGLMWRQTSPACCSCC